VKRKEFSIGIAALTISFLFVFFTPFAFGSSSANATFDVFITAEDIVGLWGLDIRLYFNAQSLDLVIATPQPPWELANVVINQIDDSAGVYRLAMVAFVPSPAFSGSTTLAKLTFTSTEEGENGFQLAETNLADKDGDPIAHTIDGLVIRGIPTHDVAVTKIRGYPRGAYQGDPVNLDVTVDNEGDFVETFTVTVYADQDKSTFGDELVVGTQQVGDLAARTSSILTFIWDTTEAPYGKYWISAEASIVPGEIDVEDNFLKGGEYIGGIYPPPAVRNNTDILTRLISVVVVASVVTASTLKIKNYWCL